MASSVTTAPVPECPCVLGDIEMNMYDVCSDSLVQTRRTLGLTSLTWSICLYKPTLHLGALTKTNIIEPR